MLSIRERIIYDIIEETEDGDINLLCTFGSDEDAALQALKALKAYE